MAKFNVFYRSNRQNRHSGDSETVRRALHAIEISRRYTRGHMLL